MVGLGHFILRKSSSGSSSLLYPSIRLPFLVLLLAGGVLHLLAAITSDEQPASGEQLLGAEQPASVLLLAEQLAADEQLLPLGDFVVIERHVRDGSQGSVSIGVPRGRNECEDRDRVAVKVGRVICLHNHIVDALGRYRPCFAEDVTPPRGTIVTTRHNGLCV